MKVHFMLPRLPGGQRVGGAEALCNRRARGPVTQNGEQVTCPDCYAQLLEIHRRFRG